MTVHMAESDLLAQLLRSPRLPIVAEKLDALLADEAQRRADFIDTVLETEKAEFVNGAKFVQSPAKFKHIALLATCIVWSGALSWHTTLAGLAVKRSWFP